MKDLQKEKELLENAKLDKNKFNELYKYFLNDVYRYSLSLLNNTHEAEDVTSRVFMEFFKKLPNYEWQNISIKNWLFTTARYFSYEAYRIPKSEELNEDFHVTDEYEISFVDQIMNLELVEKVKEEIQKLNPVEREVISLRIWEGLGFKEIAQIQSSSEDTTKKRFYRSIEKLKKALESKGIRSIIALPLLFTCIKQVGFTPAYAASINLFHAAQIGKNGILKITNTNIMENTQNILMTKTGIGVITAIITAAALTGGILIHTNKNKTQPTANNAEMNVPTATPTLIFTPATSITPSITAIPQITEITQPTLNPEDIRFEQKLEFQFINDPISELTFTNDGNTIVQKIDSSFKPSDFEDEYVSFYKYRVFDTTNPDLFNLVIGNPYESFGKSLPDSIVTLEKTNLSDNLYRIELAKNVWVYSDSVSYDEKCDFFRTHEPPCGSETLSTKDKSLFFIRCDASTTEGVQRCDDIVQDMSSRRLDNQNY